MRKNIITIIELIIVLCVIVVAVRVQNYNNIFPIPEDNTHKKQISVIYKYYVEWTLQSDEKKAKYKVISWLNGRLPSLSIPIPEGIIKAYINKFGFIDVTF
ncbi:MAG: hypothetical protein ABRQ39_32000, partial [Candidatus Eremiobacterota bacterium]